MCVFLWGFFCFCFFSSTVVFLAGISGSLTWVRHSSRKSSATHLCFFGGRGEYNEDSKRIMDLTGSLTAC